MPAQDGRQSSGLPRHAARARGGISTPMRERRLAWGSAEDGLEPVILILIHVADCCCLCSCVLVFFSACQVLFPPVLWRHRCQLLVCLKSQLWLLVVCLYLEWPCKTCTNQHATGRVPDTGPLLPGSFAAFEYPFAALSMPVAPSLVPVSCAATLLACATQASSFKLLAVCATRSPCG